MMNLGALAAEIVSLFWGTPANFNGFRVLAALLHSQTAALNRGRHLYSAGQPSRWALAHISSSLCGKGQYKYKLIFKGWYGDGAGKTTDENSSVFSLI